MKPKLLTLAALVFAASTAIAQTGATAGAAGGPGSSAAGANTGVTAGAAGSGAAASGGGATMTPGAGDTGAGGTATSGTATGAGGSTATGASGSTVGGAANPAAAPRQLDETVMPGWSTMSAAERSEMQRQMSGFTSYAECTAFMSKHRQQMQSRGGEASTPTAGASARDACDHLPRR